MQGTRVVFAVTAIITYSLCVQGKLKKQDRDDFLHGTFPADFIWGTATASYQIEGAWNISGKGENIWDFMTHSNPSGVANGDTGDVACDSYHKYEDDIVALKEIGVNFYRFSLSWSRILPTGRHDVINADGIRYYNRVINQLLTNGITPLITLYHWDLPQPLQAEFGGWLHEDIVDIFGDYARVCFSHFGDRVKHWITLNEPWEQAENGYGTGKSAPRITGSGIKDYIAAHNLIKAHARAWHIYNATFRAKQQGEIGITYDVRWFEPKTNSSEDVDAAERAMQFMLGWFAHPVFSTEGDYPQVMKDYISRHSQEEGYNKSRLPEFDQASIDYIKGTYDFFGLNHYSSSLVSFAPGQSGPSYENDQDLVKSYDPSWPSSSAAWLKVVPWGLRKTVNWIKKEYNNPRIIVTENGYADLGGLEDQDRIDYLTAYINELLKAVTLDACDVFGYTAWSIVDNFEWSDGYTQKFGLYQVNFTDPARPRTQKSSARAYSKIIRDNGFPAPTIIHIGS